jgi:hypothetical protein
MAAKERKQRGRADAGAKDAITAHDVDREFRTVNRGLLAIGLVMAIIAIFMAPETVRSLCISVNRGNFVQDAFEIEFFNEESHASSQILEGHIVSSGERFIIQRIDVIGLERLRQLALQGNIPGHRAPVWYLPRRGVWAWIDRLNEFRVLSPDEFEIPLATKVGFVTLNIAFALGGALLVRREIRRALKESRN